MMQIKEARVAFCFFDPLFIILNYSNLSKNTLKINYFKNKCEFIQKNSKNILQNSKKNSMILYELKLKCPKWVER